MLDHDVPEAVTSLLERASVTLFVGVDPGRRTPAEPARPIRPIAGPP